jgi:hypothetical protein
MAQPVYVDSLTRSLRTSTLSTGNEEPNKMVINRFHDEFTTRKFDIVFPCKHVSAMPSQTLQ